jgi:hypothetical protein
MPKFISISTFSTLYSSHADILSAEGLGAFKAKLVSTEGLTICRAKGIEKWELEHFVSTLDSPENLVFYGWIAQNPGLEKLLTQKGELTKFEISSVQLKHQLFESYKRFISPYLSQALLRFKDADKRTIAVAFSYVQILDADHSAVVEEQLFGSIQKELKSAKSRMKELFEEQELVDLIRPLCSDEIVLCVNRMSRSMYASKLNYVDDILGAIRSKACTARFANWILKRMELIELNQEHAYKINDLRKELREGSIRVRNTLETGRAPTPWKTIVTTLLIALIGAFIFYVVKYQPFSDVESPKLTDNTAFTQFTIDERLKIDSLLREMGGDREDEDIWIDNSIPIMGGSATVSTMTEFENERMQGIYEDLLKDANLQERGYSDTCVRAMQYERPNGVKDLKSKTGRVEAMIRNDSEYDVIVLVSENKSGGNVHSMFLRAGEIKVFDIDEENTLTLVAGNTFHDYSPPNITADELPSASFKHHFCDIDMNYGKSINTSYVLKRLNGGKTKFMVTGDLGGSFALLDIYNVLEFL